MLNRISLNRLVLAVASLIVVAMVVLSVYSDWLIDGIHKASVDGRVRQNAMLLAKEARFQAIQVQQFLTDASATGEKEPFGEAERARDGARRALEQLAMLEPSLSQQITTMRDDVTRLHGIGVEMAHAYVGEGRDAGNAIMKRPKDGFDDFAAALAERIDALVSDLTAQSAAALEQTTVAVLHIRYLTRLSSVALLIALVVGIFAVRRIVVTPIEHLRNSMNEIARGDGDLTRRLEVNGSNEIAQVSRSFNQFVERIRAMVRKVAQDSAQLATASDELSRSAEDTRRGMRQLHEQTEAASAAVVEMTANVQEVSGSADLAAQSAGQSDAAAQHGREVIAVTIKALRELAGEVERAGRAMKELDGEVSEVSGTLAIIRDIAAQTNLLALNAAIEAARAGEHGRGFAVVADEVRKLAQRTHESTGSIETVMSRLQEGSKQAVAVMEEGQQLATRTVQHASTAEGALDEIVEAMGRIRTMVSQIAEAVITQREASEHISNSIVAITTVADRTADEAQQTSRETARMAQLMGQLTSLVDEFRIGHDRGLDLTRAKTAHLAWKSRMRAFLDGETSLTPSQAVSHRDCDFGKWYYSAEGQHACTHIRELGEVEAPHAELHRTIGEIIRLRGERKNIEAEQQFSRIEDLSGRIVKLLEAAERSSATR